MQQGGSYLSQAEREQLWHWRRQGRSFRWIGRQLERSHTTLARECREGDAAAYQPSQAHQRAVQRITAQRASAPTKNSRVRAYVKDKLTLDWSPEQIAGRLAREGLGTISPETIYAWVYGPAWKPDTLWVYLRRGQPRRRQYPGRKAKRQLVPNRTFIAARPPVVGTRNRYGDWETDLMEGTHATRAVLSVTTERRSGYTLLAPLSRKTAAAKEASLVAQLSSLPPWLRRTVTTDSGSENARHQAVSQALQLPIYFCHPYHSWEKGTVENTIGLIRQYLPKRTSLANLTTSDVALVTNRLNHRPRKRLDYLTPHEVFSHQLGVVHFD